MKLDEIKCVNDEVALEMFRQVLKWGIQSHPDYTPEGCPVASTTSCIAKATVEAKAAGKLDEELSWWDILYEEVMEAYDELNAHMLVKKEIDIQKLRTELIQIAAVCCSWVEDIDRKENLK